MHSDPAQPDPLAYCCSAPPQVIVIDCIGSAAPIAIGVTLANRVIASDVIAAARKMLDPPEREEEELVLSQPDANYFGKIYEGKEDMPEHMFSHETCLYRSA